MATNHERLKEAAKLGSGLKLRALLNDPGCDALAKDRRGLTALMWAASNGHERCVRLLVPESDALAKDHKGLTASGWAADRGHHFLVQVIDAYALAQSEQVALGVAVCVGAPRGGAARRV